ncbi:MAG: class D beta-lactamase [Chitinophagaceae bacterium]|nr:class D beta-lactamase [Oligoflexus sp.]
MNLCVSVLGILLWLIQGCVTARPIKPVLLTEEFAAYHGCFLLYNMKTKVWQQTYGGPMCRLSQTACSTFKVPLALMAFDNEILGDEKSKLVWDRKPHVIASWNQDQTAVSWMKDSVVWFSQDITQALGPERVTAYLESFQYGNHNMSGGIKDAWLTKAPFVPEVKSNANKLQISPFVQARFMIRLWSDPSDLPVKPSALEKTKNIIFIEDSPEGFTISGKTGSGFTDSAFKRRLGWYVVHGEGHGEEYVAVVLIIDKSDQNPGQFGSAVARQIMQQTLHGYGLY